MKENLREIAKRCKTLWCMARLEYSRLRSRVEDSHHLITTVVCLAILAAVVLSAVTVTGYVSSPPECPDCEPRLSCPEQGQPTINLSCKPSNVYCQSCPELPLYMREMENVAEAHDWERNRYLCGDFSVELFGRLVADGYEDAYLCYGIYKDCDKDTDPWKCGHAWVKIGRGTSIILEAVWGTVIPPKDYGRLYEELECWNHVPWNFKRMLENSREV